MKPIPMKQRVLFGALLLAAGIYLVDTLTGGAEPRPANAAPAAQPQLPSIGPWQDVSGLIARLTAGRYQPLDGELDALSRDLFAPTPTVEKAFGIGVARKQATPESSPTERSSDFQQNHRLEGVVLGRQPLALINGQVYALNSDLDGYKLIEISRSHVDLHHPPSGRRVRLELPQGPETR